MTRKELLRIYEQLQKVRIYMDEIKAPHAMRARIKDAMLAVSWGLDHVE